MAGWLTTITTVLAYLLALGLTPVILSRKRNSTSAIAWLLAVFLLPYLGVVIYFLFGHDHIARPLQRKRSHRSQFQERIRESDSALAQAAGREYDIEEMESWENMGRLARRMGATGISSQNDVAFYFNGGELYDRMIEAIEGAAHHVHLEFFIYQPDDVGERFRDAMMRKAREGVEVRFLYDAIGSRNLRNRFLQPLRHAGVHCTPFLPINPLRRRIQVNLRNHRKILVVDGRTGFVGGFNIGREYLGLGPLGPWRDAAMRISGPAVEGLQQVFVEDWDFATGAHLAEEGYFPQAAIAGRHQLQIAWSGPDQENNTIREIYFAAVTNAHNRLWIMTPYFVPDEAFVAGIRSAALTGADVRVLTQLRPDKRVTLWASRYYWPELLEVGVKIYQYKPGMVHGKTIIADTWATLGTANLDNRSLHLNFEVNSLIYSADLVDRLAESFERDLFDAVQVDPEVFAERPRRLRMQENFSRLLSPLL
jgi:cardiolipin synthase A/B